MTPVATVLLALHGYFISEPNDEIRGAVLALLAKRSYPPVCLQKNEQQRDHMSGRDMRQEYKQKKLQCKRSAQLVKLRDYSPSTSVLWASRIFAPVLSLLCSPSKTIVAKQCHLPLFGTKRPPLRPPANLIQDRGMASQYCSLQYSVVAAADEATGDDAVMAQRQHSSKQQRAPGGPKALRPSFRMDKDVLRFYT